MSFDSERSKKYLLFAVDAMIFVVSYLLALGVANRDVVDIHYRWFEYLWMLSVVVVVKIVLLARFKFYHEIVRYASLAYASKIMKYTIFGSLLSVAIIHMVLREIGMSVLIIDWMASCILIGFSRFGWRYVKEGRFDRSQGRNTLLYGAGEHGAAVARYLRCNEELGCKVVGFVDDSPDKSSKKIEGVPVMGSFDSLSETICRHDVKEVVVSFANPDGDLVKKVFHACRQNGVRCRIVPGMADVIAGNEAVRNIDIADLMRRPQRTLDKEAIGDFIKGRRVLITGAAGSIGSEIFRQVLSYEPASVAALDHSEYGLYKLDETFSSHPLKSRCYLSLVDVKYKGLVEEAFEKIKPDIVFHAAAYKHVPILEQDIKQAVFNNVKGLFNVIESSKKFGVKKFVFISTDKAVRPTNIMGATKRIGELLVQLSNSPKIKCLGVRFGNVLASSGSVVPKFLKQVRSGGPVTVTHPEITRYFMLIPEAVELVLQAATMGDGGEIFVLDMGKPVKILEMAEDLISLTGRVPHSEIKIVYTGLRPGEKLFEELFLGEIERPTAFKDIHIGKVESVDAESFFVNMNKLFGATEIGTHDEIRTIIKSMVPEYSTYHDSGTHR